MRNVLLAAIGRRLRRWRHPGAVPPPISYAEVRALDGARIRQLAAGDPATAARWIGAAARYGLVEAQTTYAQMLLDGSGVARDPAAAFAWFRVAAGAGDPVGMNMVGRCHEHGWGTAPDLAAAASCYRQAAALGEAWAKFNLAGLLLRGRGVPCDRAAALALYRDAAGQGHAKSMNMIGRFLEEGWDTPPDPAAAATWYAAAAQGGDFRGQYNLATLLAQQGRVTEAARWFAAAVASGNPDVLRAAAGLAGSAAPELRGIAARARAATAAANHDVGECDTRAVSPIVGVCAESYAIIIIGMG